MKPNKDALRTAPKYRRFAAQNGEDGYRNNGDTMVNRHAGKYGAGMIRDVSLVTRGEALGHGFWVDNEFVKSVADGVNNSGEDPFGVKSRFTHPGLSSDGLATHLGRAANASVVGDQAFADLHFTQSAHNTPDGDLASYVMDMAAESPRDVAISIVFEPDAAAEEKFFIEHGGKLKEIDDGWSVRTVWDSSGFQSPDPLNEKNLPHARMKKLWAADFVGDPAANPGGLFEREQQFAAEASGLADYALGLSDARPNTVQLGLDADRVREFLNRYLANHNLEIKPKMENESNHNEDVENETSSTETETQPVNETETPAAEAVAQSNPRDEAAKFHKAFGVKGAVWYAEGVSFDEAGERYRAELASETEALKKQVSEMQKKLSATEGEASPVSFNANEEHKHGGFASKLRFK